MNIIINHKFLTGPFIKSPKLAKILILLSDITSTNLFNLILKSISFSANYWYSSLLDLLASDI